MRTELKFLAFSGAFGLGVGAVYWFVSYERTGTVLLLLMGVSAAFMGAYLLARGIRSARPEDDPRAEHGRETGMPVGYFHAKSIWPFVMAVGATAGAIGLVYGIWLAVPVAILFAAATVGMMRESRG